jgi:hypothetical protein
MSSANTTFVSTGSRDRINTPSIPNCCPQTGYCWIRKEQASSLGSQVLCISWLQGYKPREYDAPGILRLVSKVPDSTYLEQRSLVWSAHCLDQSAAGHHHLARGPVHETLQGPRLLDKVIHHQTTNTLEKFGLSNQCAALEKTFCLRPFSM